MRLILLNLLFFCSYTSIAQDYWQATQQVNINKSNQDIPRTHQAYSLDLATFVSELNQTPTLDFSKKTKGKTIHIPVYDHGVVAFETYESSVMMPKLQGKFPNLRTYKGFARNGKFRTRFSISSKGLNITIIGEQQVYQVDPIDLETYAAYDLKHYDHDADNSHFACGTADPTDHLELDDLLDQENIIGSMKSGPLANEVVEMREYRLAMACTGEFGAKWGDTKEQVLEIMVSSVNSMNLIWENDLALRMVLVDQQLDVIFLDPDTDPYDQAVSGFGLLGVNTNVINNAIGFDSYDVGHIYTNGCNDTGGVANLSSTCGGNKGAGVTCMSGNNIAFNTLRIAAHEFGHQMGANHTFNNCNGNENFGTAYEPGGGTTVMSYAGICGSNNVQSGPDPYYHNISLNEIFNHTRNGGGTCGTIIETGNTNPTASIKEESGFFIPVLTPFILEGSGTDAEDTNLTYSWEQFNLGPQSDLGTPLNNAPSFRSEDPGDSPIRYCPDLIDVVNGLKRDSEVMPELSREMTFRLTVRDNNPNGGGVDYEEIKFRTAQQSGPFLVQYPNLAEILEVGQEIEVLWDVAGTNESPVNCAFVDIMLSTNGGTIYDKILVQNTANDGTEKVIIPNSLTERARIMIRARGNIFYDISNFPFNIVEPANAGYYYELQAIQAPICLPNEISLDISSAGFQGYSESISFDVTNGLPPGATYAFSPTNINPGDPANLTIDLSNVSQSDIYNIEITATSGSQDPIVRNLNIETIYNQYDDLMAMSPTDGASGINGLPSFEWSDAEAAESYHLQVATSPAFGAEDLVVDQLGLSNTAYNPDFIFDNNEIFYWRVRGLNRCGEGAFGAISAFHTISLSCETWNSSDTPINISASGTRTVESKIEVFDNGAIQDVNVKKVKGNHEQVSDLKMTLISPMGSEVVLVERQCGNLANFDVGFDDESPNVIDCPITGGVTFKPVENLSALSGQDRAGTWTLKIDDLSPGFGGAFAEFVLELCADQAVNNPFIVNNVALETPPGYRDQITSDLLLSDDTDNTASELIYTLVQNTQNGELSFNDQSVSIGDQFTQADINANLVKYEHDGGSSTTDHFRFTVKDPNGGWISITQFDINIDPAFTSSIDDISNEIGLKVYPNPIDNFLNIDHDQLQENINFELYNLTGQKVMSFSRDASTKSDPIHVSTLADGVYLLQVKYKTQTGTQKIVVQH